MSDDLIKRSDVINLLWYFQDECCSAVVGDVEKLPSADRPQGQWIEMYRNGFGNIICMCSKCNFHTTKSNFCPNCGARMKGADDETNY